MKGRRDLGNGDLRRSLVELTAEKITVTVNPYVSYSTDRSVQPVAEATQLYAVGLQNKCVLNRAVKVNVLMYAIKCSHYPNRH